jgi:methylated-DNA-[protein]-cysteine S-methyltransferase
MTPVHTIVHEFTLDRVSTPVGPILIACDPEARLRALYWEDHEERMHRQLAAQYRRTTLQWVRGRAPRPILHALEAYVAGKLDALTTIPTATAGTPFQRSVWAALRTIPVGSTITYGDLAARIGRPIAVRAVGHANGSNPISIVVPCHRVIGADGSLTGFGGGIERKRWLLEHEGALE